MSSVPAKTLPVDTASEWLEADGLGGFASGTSAGIPTRRYHALLLAAARPPADRFVLVNGLTAWLETADGPIALSSHHYAPSVTSSGATVECFEAEPWPCFRYRTHTGLVLSQEVVALHGSPSVIVRFRLLTPRPGVVLCVRPLLSGRDFHHLHHENPGFCFDSRRHGELVEWSPYPAVPVIRSLANGSYEESPDWYRRFRYAEEARRGLDCDEDLATPGVLRFDLAREPALWQLEAGTPGSVGLFASDDVGEISRRLERERTRRERYRSPLERAADAYLVERGGGRTIIAGYPWFGDWGRDTFIALRGACLATERLSTARDILLEWAGKVSDGMLPNRFPDQSAAEPEYNAVDASLWFVIVAAELQRRDARGALSARDRRLLEDAQIAIVSGYARGTRFAIRRDTDGLLAAGAVGTQLTWMDAKVGEHVVTPRIGKPVEVQALWLNALHATQHLSAEFSSWLAQGLASFEARFYDAGAGALYDVIDVDHRPGTVDAAFRPNQIFAAGGLPLTLLSPERARRVVDAVEARLWTPLGLRSLAAGEPGYAARYEGGVWERDNAYHQGTVWPWLTGPFVEAWVRSRGASAEAKDEARRRFVAPLREHLARAGLGHVSEIADGEPPHTPRGCPFQAWSLTELLRLELDVLGDETSADR